MLSGSAPAAGCDDAESVHGLLQQRQDIDAARELGLRQISDLFDQFGTPPTTTGTNTTPNMDSIGFCTTMTTTWPIHSSDHG